MSQGNGFDDETPTEGIAIGHPDNREVLAFLGNDVLELKEHTRVIQTLYEAMRGFHFPIGLRMQAQIVEEYERHHEANTVNLALLKSVVGG